MHYLIGLLIVALVAYLVLRSVIKPSAAANTNISAGQSSSCGLAFLSNGMIFTREPGGELSQLDSLYAQEVMDRREKSQRRHSWKEGTSFNVSAGGGSRSYEDLSQPLVATSLVYEANGDLLYFLKDESIGGLFRREANSGRELRLMLKQGLQLSDLVPSPDGNCLAAASRQSDGVSNIVLMQRDGDGCREITGGDSIDSAPAWIPGVADRLLFQSCGLARNQQGHILAIGNATIQKLDMGRGTVTPILEDAAFDYLKPRVLASGELLFIRRPHETPSYGPLTILTDILSFPFRLLRAVFHYLNFFSMMYSRKPLTSADNPAVKADVKDILLQGKRIDMEKALREARPIQGVPSLVPDSWQLVQREQNGQEKVLATNVVSYDLSVDGSIVYSNGRGVFVLNRDGSSSLALSDKMVIESVAASVLAHS